MNDEYDYIKYEKKSRKSFTNYIKKYMKNNFIRLSTNDPSILGELLRINKQSWKIIYRCNDDEIPDLLWDVYNLEKLYLNCPKHIPDKLIEFEELKCLSIKNIELKEFPSIISDLKQLNNLSISNCKYNYNSIFYYFFS